MPLLKRLLVAALAPLVVTLAWPVIASAQVPAIRSCADIKAAHPRATDGDYIIYPVGLPQARVDVYCAGMATTPREYISLPRQGAGSNFSQYTAGGAAPGTSVVTHYTRLRFDPVPVQLNPLTYRVNIADQTFSSSTGVLCHGTVMPCPSSAIVRSMPYGVAMDCTTTRSARGLANLDLRGTRFVPVDSYTIQGFLPGGATAIGGTQVLNVTGGGFCGWNAPATTSNPFNANPLGDANRGWDLRIVSLLSVI
jgi:hypothetical protein